jgi:DNA-directed RNA polymerase specialized sigma24 family protein
VSKSDSLEDVVEAHLAVCTDEAIRLDIVAALESLPAHYLEVILLRDFAELTIAEMATQLKMEVPGLKSRLHRARELVREYLTAKS